jgi:hypothetical protein
MGLTFVDNTDSGQDVRRRYPMSAKRIRVKAWACKCEREPCGHEWVTLTDQLPKVCPKCKALTWNKVRGKKTKS